MQQIIKNSHSLRGMIAASLLTAFLWGCNNPEKKVDESTPAPAPAKMDSPATVKQDSGASLKMTATDSLPPIDKTATSRPEDKKTVIKPKN